MIYSANLVGDPGNSLKWYDDLDLAVKEAELAHKPILVLFYSDWCPKCHKFFDTTIADALVQDKLKKKYVIVKVDTVKNPQIKSEFKVHRRPTVVFLNQRRKEEKRIEGYINPNEFLKQL